MSPAAYRVMSLLFGKPELNCYQRTDNADGTVFVARGGGWKQVRGNLRFVAGFVPSMVLLLAVAAMGGSLLKPVLRPIMWPAQGAAIMNALLWPLAVYALLSNVYWLTITPFTELRIVVENDVLRWRRTLWPWRASGEVRRDQTTAIRWDGDKGISIFAAGDRVIDTIPMGGILNEYHARALARDVRIRFGF